MPWFNHSSSIRWALSTDGRPAWQKSEALTSAAPPPTFMDTTTRGRPDRWRLAALTEHAGVCGIVAVERGSDSIGWVEDFRLSAAEYSDISTGCGGAQMGVMGSIAALDSSTGAQVVVSLGADGVPVRDADGRWERTGVLSARRVERTALDTFAGWAVFASGPALKLVIWLRRRRWPTWWFGLMFAWGGWLVTTMTLVLIAFEPRTTVFLVGIPAVALTAVVSIAVARRPRPPRRPPPPSPAGSVSSARRRRRLRLRAPR